MKRTIVFSMRYLSQGKISASRIERDAKPCTHPASHSSSIHSANAAGDDANARPNKALHEHKSMQTDKWRNVSIRRPLQGIVAQLREIRNYDLARGAAKHPEYVLPRPGLGYASRRMEKLTDIALAAGCASTFAGDPAGIVACNAAVGYTSIRGNAAIVAGCKKNYGDDTDPPSAHQSGSNRSCDHSKPCCPATEH